VGLEGGAMSWLARGAAPGLVLLALVVVVVDAVSQADGYMVFASDAAYAGLVEARSMSRALWEGTTLPAPSHGTNPLWVAMLTLLQLPLAGLRPDPQQVEAVPALLSVVLVFWMLRGLCGGPSPLVPHRLGAAAVVICAALPLACVDPDGSVLVAAILVGGLRAWTAGRPGLGWAAALGLCGPVGFAVGPLLVAVAVARRRPLEALAQGLLTLGPAVVTGLLAHHQGWPSALVSWPGVEPAFDLSAGAVVAMGLVGLGLGAPLPQAAGVISLALAGAWSGLSAPWVVVPGMVLLLRHWPTGRRWAVPLAALAVLGLVQPMSERAHAKAWQGRGQAARFVAEFPLPGTVGVAGAALVRWRADRSLVDLSCEASPEAWRACEAGRASVVDSDIALLVHEAGGPRLPQDLGPGARVVRRWIGARDVSVDLVVRNHRVAEELIRLAQATAWRLPAEVVETGVSVAGGLSSAEGPSVLHAEPTDACGAASPSVLQLSGADLRNSQQTVHGGRLVAERVDLALPGPWQAGAYSLELDVRVTPFDGSGARLELECDGALVAAFTLDEGDGRREQLSFTLPEPWEGPLRLRYVNDASDEERDRNVVIGGLQISRQRSVAPETRAGWLREGVAGSNLVVVSIDTLRADHLGTYGYDKPTSPVIDALAARGARFDNAIAASHWTAPSHVSLLTGLHPVQHGVRAFPNPGRLSPEVPTLAELLSEAGYDTAGFAAGLYVGEGIGLADGFGTWVERVAPARHRMEEASAWVRGHAETAPDTPFFLFVHTYQVHDPYDPPPPYDRWFQDDPGAPIAEWLRLPHSETTFPGWRPDAEQLATQVALYDGEIRYTDEMLGQLLDTLAEAGVADDTLVVITSDHGEEFFDHGWVGHGRLFKELLHVPLVLAHPALPGVAQPAVSQPVGHVDVVPTVLDLLGVDAPADLPGRSAVSAMAGACDAEARAYSSSIMNRQRGLSVYDRAGHYIDDDGQISWYDHGSDVAETHDRSGEVPHLVEPYATAAEGWWSGLEELAAPTDVDRSSEELEMLKLLGYAE